MRQTQVVPSAMTAPWGSIIPALVKHQAPRAQAAQLAFTRTPRATQQTHATVSVPAVLMVPLRVSQSPRVHHSAMQVAMAWLPLLAPPPRATAHALPVTSALWAPAVPHKHHVLLVNGALQVQRPRPAAALAMLATTAQCQQPQPRTRLAQQALMGPQRAWLLPRALGCAALASMAPARHKQQPPAMARVLLVGGAWQAQHPRHAADRAALATTAQCQQRPPWTHPAQQAPTGPQRVWLLLRALGRAALATFAQLAPHPSPKIFARLGPFVLLAAALPQPAPSCTTAPLLACPLPCCVPALPPAP